MKMKLDEFLSKNEPAGRSKMDKFINEIFELKERNFTLDQILIFLKNNEVSVSKPSLVYFIKTRSSKIESIRENENKNKSNKQSNLSEKKFESKKSEEIQEIKKPSFVPNGYEPPAWAEKDLDTNRLV